ncbi:acylphosphatase-1-like [Diorhabda sublineata]|uniref:acylphosphatase-1-like n=1 Tax=Diorhabda sublineata TaxID=1163346 RepID=UPI0024E0738A|nr:acylphosphatase-1-like [Diorhabda sublineata]
MAEKLISVEFEVFGRVQGVLFGRYMMKAAKYLQVRGLITNTHRHSVKGVIEGRSSSIESMKWWLRKQGSPFSYIALTIFTDEKEIDQYTYKSFKVRA